LLRPSPVIVRRRHRHRRSEDDCPAPAEASRVMMFLSFAALLRCRSLVRSLLSWSSPVVVQVDALATAWLSSPRGRRWCSRCCCGRRPDRWGRAITAAVGRRILAPRPAPDEDMEEGSGMSRIIMSDRGETLCRRRRRTVLEPYSGNIHATIVVN